MKKIIQLSQKKDGKPIGEFWCWSVEMEVSKFPSVLKKGECSDCSTLLLDKTKKDLVLAQRLIESNWEYKGRDFAYTCLKHSSFILEEKIYKVHNLQDLEDIRKELKNHA